MSNVKDTHALRRAITHPDLSNPPAERTEIIADRWNPPMNTSTECSEASESDKRSVAAEYIATQFRDNQLRGNAYAMEFVQERWEREKQLAERKREREKHMLGVP
jgi:hypothetical protein